MIDATMTMNLNHLIFPSLEFAGTASLFETYLVCSVSQKGTHSWTLKRPGFDIIVEDAGEDLVNWPQNFHLGFELPTVQAVRALWEGLRADGVEIQTDFFKHVRGSRFFCRAPGGVLVEINTRADADEAYRGTFET